MAPTEPHIRIPRGACHAQQYSARLRFQREACNASITVSDIKATVYNYRQTAKHACTQGCTDACCSMYRHRHVSFFFLTNVEASLGACQGGFLGNRLSCLQDAGKYFQLFWQQTEWGHAAKARSIWTIPAATLLSPVKKWYVYIERHYLNVTLTSSVFEQDLETVYTGCRARGRHVAWLMQRWATHEWTAKVQDLFLAPLPLKQHTGGRKKIPRMHCVQGKCSTNVVWQVYKEGATGMQTLWSREETSEEQTGCLVSFLDVLQLMCTNVTHIHSVSWNAKNTFQCQ